MIGEILKKKREELGLDLKEIAHNLRIQYEYLKAIENNTPDKLPPDVYTKGYIKEYARFLNIDPEPLIHEYAEQKMSVHAEIQPEPPPVKKNFTFPRSLPVVPAVIIIIVLLIIYLPRIKFPQKESEIPETSTPSTTFEGSQITPSKTNPQPHYILTVNAIETTWLRIEMEGGRSEEVLMRPGETKKWTSQKGFNLRLGNAGGVRLVLNDRDMGTPGVKGQVVKLTLP